MDVNTLAPMDNSSDICLPKHDRWLVYDTRRLQNERTNERRVASYDTRT